MIPGGYQPNPERLARSGGAESLAGPDGERVGAAALSGLVVGAGGKPLQGATISLAGSGFWPARSVQSGPDGRFSWTGIPPGVYELRAAKGRLVAPPVAGLILDAGSHRAFGMQLALGWTVAGRIVDAQTGRGVSGAELTLSTGGLGMHARRSKSDPSGAFELLGIVGEPHGLYAEADGYVPVGPLRVDPEGGGVTVRLERASRIEGRVVDERGRPIEGATVRAYGEWERPQATLGVRDSLGITAGPVPPISSGEAPGLAFAQQAQTGRDGSFRLPRLRAGAYALSAVHEGFASAESERLLVASGAARTGIELVMRVGGELTGVVVDERGTGLEGIPIELRAPDERLPRMTVSGPDGAFSFRGVLGSMRVTALPYDLPPASAPVEVEGEGQTEVELILSTTLYSLRGQVVDERGFPVSGALLTVTSPDPDAPVRRTAKSEADGTFSVPALPEPPFLVEVEHPAFSNTRLGEVEADEDLEVVLYAGVTLLGTVFDRWASEGLRGVAVHMEGPATLDARTRADGTFVFRKVPTGVYTIRFSHTDYEPQSRRVVLDPPQYVDRPQELDVVWLEPGGSVEGEVLDAYDDPVPNAEVTWGDPPRWERAARTDSSGRFRLRGVPAGSTWLTARHDVAGEATSDDWLIVRPLETSPGAVVRLPEAHAE